MGAFDALRIANTSLGMHQTWLDALANNIANANTIVPTSQSAFRTQYVVASARPDGGVDVSRIALGDATGQLVYQPDNPLADPIPVQAMPPVDCERGERDRRLFYDPMFR